MQKKIGRSPLCRPGHRGRVRLLRTGLCSKPARYALSCGIKCDTQLGEQAHVRSDSSRHNEWVHRWKYLASRLHNQPLIYPSGIRSGSKNRSASPAKKYLGGRLDGTMATKGSRSTRWINLISNAAASDCETISSPSESMLTAPAKTLLTPKRLSARATFQGAPPG